MKIRFLHHYTVISLLLICGCHSKKDDKLFQQELQSIDIARGEITLCGSEQARFGTVQFSLNCSEKVRADFNLATALLHSFEYTEAEKIFARVIDADPECLMGYWGVAMSNFHPLWSPPTNAELDKGSKTIKLARTLDSKSKRESDYLEAVGTLYDNWEKLDHRARLLKFEEASQKIYQQYPDDKEAAIFYALALRAAADPTDKTFEKQKKAGDILKAMFPNEPNHPGIAHYLIHTYDYPELAELGLPAARKYAAIAATSAHALHMPSHIFTRLGLWDEAAQSNINSMSAAKCYAENSGMKGHWDEELHGLDYLVYAYLQQARDDKAQEQLDYLNTIEVVEPINFKDAYTFSAVPARLALERKDWKGAAALDFKPVNFPWKDFPWESSITLFAKALGAVHVRDKALAQTCLAELKINHAKLLEKNKNYEAKQVLIQVKAVEAWIELMAGHKKEAITLMTESADMEDATEKHPVTPGEVLPTRELLGDMLMEVGAYADASKAYEDDLKRHAGRFNGLYGAALAAQKLGDAEKAKKYYTQLTAMAQLSNKNRPELLKAESYTRKGV